ncbi:MAG TPA: NAD-dependent epimerase/dehydratase family protein [Taishania sp.]|nr:NAD-dependent epimerase/dehydratase family protein [Taishania sp.]
MILVTGGTGLLGSHLLYELMKDDTRKVRALYRDHSRITKVKSIFDYYSKGVPHRFDDIEWVQGDVLDLFSLEEALDGINMVYHCAAMVSFHKRDFKKMVQINRLGTANMVNMSLKVGVKKFGFVSSTAALGGKENVPVTESDKWQITPTTSGYSISKFNSEREVWRACEEGMDVVIINPCLIFGAGDYDESSLSIFRTVSKGLKIYSPGSNAYVDARDVATCFVRLMNSEVKNEQFLVVAHNLTFKSSLIAIANKMGVKQPSFCPPKWMALFIAKCLEFFSGLLKRRSTISVDSARSAYSKMSYSNEKLLKTINHQFYSFDETIENVITFHKLHN